MTSKIVGEPGRTIWSATSPSSSIWCTACTSQRWSAQTVTASVWLLSLTWISLCRFRRLDWYRSSYFGCLLTRANAVCYSTSVSKATNRSTTWKKWLAKHSKSTNTALTLCWFKTTRYGGSFLNTSSCQLWIIRVWLAPLFLPLKLNQWPLRKTTGTSIFSRPVCVKDGHLIPVNTAFSRIYQRNDSV